MPQIPTPPPRTLSKLARSSEVIALGDSLTVMDGNKDTKFASTVHLSLGAVFSMGRIRHRRNAGVTGETTAQILARVKTDVIDYAPGKCIVLGGTNDVAQTGTISTNTSMTNLTQIYRRLEAAGIEPIGATIPPSFYGDRHIWIARLNARILDYCAKHGYHCLDYHAVLTDPATRQWIGQGTPTGYDTGAGLANGDGVHPGYIGARVMGHLLADQIGPIMPANYPYLCDAKDSLINLFDNGTFTGDSNGDGMADLWSAAGSSAGTVSLVAGAAPVVGNWQKVTLAASGIRRVQQTINMASASPKGCAAGDVLYFSGRIRSDAETGLIPVVASVAFFDAGSAVLLAPTPVNGVVANIDDGVFWMRMTVPTGTASIAAGVSNLAAAGSGSGVGSYQVAQMTLINATRLGFE